VPLVGRPEFCRLRVAPRLRGAMGEYAAVNVSRQSPVSPHRAIRPLSVRDRYRTQRSTRVRSFVDVE